MKNNEGDSLDSNYIVPRGLIINTETLQIGNIEVNKGPWAEHFYFETYFEDNKCEALFTSIMIDVAVMVCGSVTLSGNGEYS